MFDRNVTKVVQDCILDSGIQAKVVADKINKPYSTLMREINPFDASAKLGAETLPGLLAGLKVQPDGKRGLDPAFKFSSRGPASIGKDGVALAGKSLV